MVYFLQERKADLHQDDNLHAIKKFLLDLNIYLFVILDQDYWLNPVYIFHLLHNHSYVEQHYFAHKARHLATRYQKNLR